MTRLSAVVVVLLLGVLLVMRCSTAPDEECFTDACVCVEDCLIINEEV